MQIHLSGFFPPFELFLIVSCQSFSTQKSDEIGGEKYHTQQIFDIDEISNLEKKSYIIHTVCPPRPSTFHHLASAMMANIQHSLSPISIRLQFSELNQTSNWG